MNAIYAMNATDTTNAAGDVVRCPTCGHLRLVQVSDEGTSSFVLASQPLEPCDCRERDALAARVAELEASNRQLEDQVAELTRTANALDQERDMARVWAGVYQGIAEESVSVNDKLLREAVEDGAWCWKARMALSAVEAFWSRYVDRVGPAEDWAAATLQKVRSALEAANSDGEEKEGEE